MGGSGSAAAVAQDNSAAKPVHIKLLVFANMVLSFHDPKLEHGMRVVRRRILHMYGWRIQVRKEDDANVSNSLICICPFAVCHFSNSPLPFTVVG